VIDDIHRHGAIVIEAGMEELHLERQLLILPQRPLGTEADVAPLVIGDLGQPRRDLATRVLERFLGELLGAAGDVLETESWCRSAGATGHLQCDQCDAEQPCGEPPAAIGAAESWPGAPQARAGRLRSPASADNARGGRNTRHWVVL